MDLATANGCDSAAFLRTFGPVFENSPWVAAAARQARPFASVDALHAAMAEVVRAATRDRQLALLNAHPELAGKEAQAGAMTDSSVAEQAAAGLDRLSAGELARLNGLNSAYRTRFGYPFIIAVRNHSKQSIFESFEQRLHHSAEQELATALGEVFKITRLRLDRLFGPEQQRLRA
jgi:OHCU decarboxylase